MATPEYYMKVTLEDPLGLMVNPERKLPEKSLVAKGVEDSYMLCNLFEQIGSAALDSCSAVHLANRKENDQYAFISYDIMFPRTTNPDGVIPGKDIVAMLMPRGFELEGRIQLVDYVAWPFTAGMAQATGSKFLRRKDRPWFRLFQNGTSLHRTDEQRLEDLSPASETVRITPQVSQQPYREAEGNDTGREGNLPCVG